MVRSCLLLSLAFALNPVNAQQKSIDAKVDSVLKLMTLEEKVGQMNQYNGDWEATGPITKDGDKQNQIKKGMLGSMINVTGYEHTKTLQELAMQSRLRIPLLFGQDIIHGYRTTFPIPLGEAASWDLEAIEKSARIAAIESSAAGVHWTFAPMVDIARDPRWGRVMEGAGEDTYLGSLIAKARVKGFQGKGLGNTDAVMACAKHFAAYGAAVGGRDYNSVDMSLRMLWETYLPPFKAAADAGVATFMNSFNDLNGIPASGNKYLQREILKNKWNFKGFIVSDWGSIGEMIQHGYVKDNEEAALSASTAGSDMDMESRSYINHLAKLVKEGKVKMSIIDEAVKRILKKKFEMGLFDDPFKFCNKEREQTQWNNKEHLSTGRDVARKSIVLLKNENQLLPLSKQTKTIAVIGPFVKAVRDNLGFWSYLWPDDSARIVTQWQGIRNRASSKTKLLYAKGCGITDISKAGFKEAVETASQADVVIVSVGEASDMSGEAKSRSNIHLPGVQEELVKAIQSSGKPVVVLVNAGRPLIFNWIVENTPAIVYTWWLGTEAGNAIGDVLFGDYNPSGKLPITFPKEEGQIPLYYNYFSTGRPAPNENETFYRSGYIDLPNSAAFPFGYGLSYTHFSYGDIRLDRAAVAGETNLKSGETLKATIAVTNTGKYDGKETVQLYVRDLVGTVVRPVKELKGFQQVFLKAGESKEISFIITTDDLRFFNDALDAIYEPGEFKLFIGGNSRDVKETSFSVR